MTRSSVFLSFAASVVFAATARGAAVGDPKCNLDACPMHNVHQYYSEIGCKPIQKDDECCPTRYDCSHFTTRDNSQCYFKGKPLDLKSELGEVVPGSCLAGCRCTGARDKDSIAQLTCANIECPSLFNPHLIPPDCVATYSGQTCCSDGVLCPQNVTKTTQKCEYGGKTYLEGEKFWPTDCKVCACRQGFDGTLDGPWCSEVTCGFELHYADKLHRGCAPVFLNGGRCCPVEWRCPENDEDKVVPAVTSKNPAEPEDPADTCKWGSQVLKKGESLSAPADDQFCQQCRCDVPPHVVCERTSGPCTEQVTAIDTAFATETEIPAVAPTAPAPDPRVTREAKGNPCDVVRCVKQCIVENGRAVCLP